MRTDWIKAAVGPVRTELREQVTHPLRYYRKLGRALAREWRRWRFGFADLRDLERLIRTHVEDA